MTCKVTSTCKPEHRLAPIQISTAQLCPLLARIVSPDRDQQDHQKGEDHLHVGQRIHAKRTQDDQLDHLHGSEGVHFPLRHTTDVVGGGIRGLRRQEQV